MNVPVVVVRTVVLALSLAWIQAGLGREPERSDIQVKTNNRAPLRTGPLSGCAAIAERVSPSVVTIFTAKTLPKGTSGPRFELFDDPFFKRFFDREGMGELERPLPKVKGLGSGVILTVDGYLVTNNHVVDGADEIKVQLPGAKKHFNATVIGSDRATDIAVLKIAASDLIAAEFGNSDLLKVGDTAIAIGNPFGLNHTVTMGIVSALGRKDLNITGYENFIQTDAPINVGNSGGALVDNHGSIVGINTAIVSGGTGGSVGIGFAIPSNMVLGIAKQLVSGGSIRRGYLGVILSNVSESLAKAFQVEPRGALVNEVLPNSPAERAGMESGDIIIEYRGELIDEMAKLRMLVANTLPDEDVECVVLRSGKRKTIEVVTGLLPNGGVASSERPSMGNELFPEVTIEELTSTHRSRWNIDEAVEGVVVTAVGSGAFDDEVRLSVGDVILEINRIGVASVDNAMNARGRDSEDVVLLKVWSKGRTRFVAVNLERK